MPTTPDYTKQFNHGFQALESLALGVGLGKWYVTLFLGFYSFTVGWTEWELEVDYDQSD